MNLIAAGKWDEDLASMMGGMGGMDMGGMDDMDLGGEDEEGKEESGAPVPRTKIYFQSSDSLHCETI